MSKQEYLEDFIEGEDESDFTDSEQGTDRSESQAEDYFDQYYALWRTLAKSIYYVYIPSYELSVYDIQNIMTDSSWNDKTPSKSEATFIYRYSLPLQKLYELVC